MFVFSSQVSGGSALGAVPLASGPRQCGQLSSAFEVGSPAGVPAPATLMARISKAHRRITVPRGVVRWRSAPDQLTDSPPLPPPARITAGTAPAAGGTISPRGGYFSRKED